jgi:hypothetical protein
MCVLMRTSGCTGMTVLCVAMMVRGDSGNKIPTIFSI